MNNILISFPDNIEIKEDSNIRIMTNSDESFSVIVDNVVYKAILETVEPYVDIFMTTHNTNEKAEKFYKTDLVSKILKVINDS